MKTKVLDHGEEMIIYEISCKDCDTVRVCVCRTVCRILPLLPSSNTPASYLAWLPVNAMLIMLTVNWNTAINATVYDIHA